MRNFLVVSLFTLAMLAWAAAQQPGAMPQGSSGQASSPSAQVPDATQSQSPSAGSAAQSGAQTGTPAGAQSQMANAPVTEGCLGGSNPNYTITDKAGTTYKLNIPAGADASPLASHVGESVAVIGPVNNKAIDVNKIGRGTSKCPGSASSGAQSPPQ